MSFTASGTGQSSRQMPAGPGPGKRQKPVKDMDLDNAPLQKPLTPRANMHIADDTKARNYVKDSRLGGTSSQLDEVRPFTHPGDLVICKKKRKDREKSAGKSSGPLSPTGPSRNIKSPVSGSGGPGPQSTSQQGWGALSPQQGNSGGGGSIPVGWANPVKKLRTDARRRPSHL